ncbi:hypothetical protein OWM54_19000 [Myxococcus sp. MISCRS1]|nr:hypothetical protein [Myxococcus sp. MISCRS1]
MALTHGDATVLVVADGAGNSRRGAEAAEVVLRGVRDAVASGAGLDHAETWRAVLERCDAELVSSGQGGETTAVVACVTSRCVVGASVGTRSCGCSRARRRTRSRSPNTVSPCSAAAAPDP